ncbi:MAG: helix-turn-helix domain-containing protein [Bacteroidales bacterium]|nr:helix-turn-helix domain-containing protein [Bacteroidales bacterium]
MSKRQGNHKKEIAQILFNQDYSQKEIAEKVGVSEQTISRWVVRYNWKKVRTNLSTSRPALLADLYQELEMFNQMIKDKTEGPKIASSKEADARRKLISDIKALETKYSIGEAIMLGQDFCNFIREIDNNLAKDVVEYYDSFINMLVQKQKWGKE